MRSAMDMTLDIMIIAMVTLTSFSNAFGEHHKQPTLSGVALRALAIFHSALMKKCEFIVLAVFLSI